MKSTFIVIAIVFTLLTSSSKLLAQNTPTIPNFDQVETITMGSHWGWDLNIYPDGSGKLIYGSSAGDDAEIPPKTFSFQDVYKLLVPHLNGKYINPQVTYFVFMQLKNMPPGAPTYALYLDDRRIIKQIMIEARDKAVSRNPERFKELLAYRSPVPDDSQ